MSSTFLLYGASGYTGGLIAELAVQQGLQPILATRSADRSGALAALGLKCRVFTLEDSQQLEAALAEVAVVLHCAGPFSQTSKQMVDACLRTQTHYLDITGEVGVFEAIAARDAEAKVAGIMLLPGVGFDVVPSDCLAAHLKARLPTATRLALGFQALGQISRGTATTMVESQHRGGLIRRDGVLTPVPAAWKTRMIDFGQGPVAATTIPWGDVSTAFYSTGIPNIEVYAAFPAFTRRVMAVSRYLSWLLALPTVQQFQKRLIQNQPPGPTDAQRQQGGSLLWGEVEDSGKKCISRLQCPEGYTLTAMTALAIMEKVLAGRFAVGFQTPSLAYGADLILEIEGVMREELD